MEQLVVGQSVLNLLPSPDIPNHLPPKSVVAFNDAASRSSSLQTRSKAFEKSRRAIRLRFGLAAWKPSLMVCVILRIWSSQGQSLRKSDCSLQSHPLVSVRLHRRLCTILSIVLTTREADRSEGGDSSWRFACLFQRGKVGFLPN